MLLFLIHSLWVMVNRLNPTPSSFIKEKEKRKKERKGEREWLEAGATRSSAKRDFKGVEVFREGFSLDNCCGILLKAGRGDLDGATRIGVDGALSNLVDNVQAPIHLPGLL